MTAEPDRDGRAEVFNDALEGITTALRAADAATREQGYASIEQAVVHENGEIKGAMASSLAAACVPTLCRDVLCADDSKVNAEEYRRACLLLARMVKFDPRVVGAAMINTEKADSNIFATWLEPCSTLGRMLQKRTSPDQFTEDDALTVAAYTSPWPMFWTDASNTFADMQIDTVEGQVASFFVWPDSTGKARGYAAEPIIAVSDGSSYEKLALMTLQLIERLLDPDFRKSVTDPEMITCGALAALTNFGQGDQKISEILFKAGAVGAAMKHLETLDPAARILKSNVLGGVALYSTKDIYTNMLEVCSNEAETTAAMKIIDDSGIIDALIASLEEYQHLDDPGDANPVYFWYGVVSALALFDYSSPPMLPVMHKLRGIAGAIKYVIEHNLKGPEGYDTCNFGNILAAKIFGRDDGEDIVLFSTQKDVDSVLDTAWEYMRPKGWGNIFPCTKTTPSQAVLAMSVSDEKKQLLLNSDKRYVELLVDGLLLDPNHPRRGADQSNFVPFQEAMQQDFAEGLYQLSLFEPGKKALLESRLHVVDELDTLIKETEGRDDEWAEKTKEFARGALMQLRPKRNPEPLVIDPDSKHIMMSYQWDVQQIVVKIVTELKKRKYKVWFDLDCMQGSVMDAMSEAVEGAELMLYGVSEKYKESGNCRLELNYGVQEEVDLVPLMMQKDYKAKGWLGLILGQSLWYAFYPEAVPNDEKFIQQMDLLTREIGDRGKIKTTVPEGVPPGHAVAVSFQPEPEPEPELESRTPEAQPHSFTPSSQQTQVMVRDVPLVNMPSTVDSSGLIERLLAKLDAKDDMMEQQRKEMDSKAEQQRMDMEQRWKNREAEMLEQQAALRADLTPAPPRPAIAESDLVSLQARLEALHTSKILSEEQRFALEDLIADWVEMQASMVGQVVTEVMLYATSGHAFAAGVKVHKMLKISAITPSDQTFGRQVVRKLL